MLVYLKENIQFYFILLLWLLVGLFGGPVIYVIVPLSLILMKQKEMFEEMIIGYFFILILSDSLEMKLYFAKNLKNVYIVIISAVFLLDTGKFYPLNRTYTIFLPFIVFSIFTLLLSVSEPFFSVSFQKTLSYFLSFLVIPNFIAKQFRESGWLFFRRFVFFCTMILITGLLLKYMLPEVGLLNGARFRGVFGGPNGLGIFCVLVYIVYFLSDYYCTDLFTRFDRTLIMFVIFISLILTGSRNAILALLIFYTFQRFFIVSPFLGTLIFIAAIFISEYVSNNASTIIVTLGLGDYFRVNTLEEGSGRLIAWEFAWKQIQKNFFIGKGFAYNEFYMRQYYGILGRLGHQGGIHNSFLSFWMDQGLVGLLIYLRSYFLIAIKGAKISRFAFPVIFAISFMAFFESWLIGSQSAFAFLGFFIFTIIILEDFHKTTTVSDSNANLILKEV